MKQLIRIAWLSTADQAKFVEAEVSPCGRFAVHVRWEGEWGWMLTHVATGHSILSCVTEDEARTAMAAFEHLTNPGWSDKNPLHARLAVAAEGIALLRALGHKQPSEGRPWSPEECERWADSFVPPSDLREERP